MKTETSFSVNFHYSLSENITVNLTANVQLRHSEPNYLVTDFHFRNNPDGSALLPDISIIAIRNESGLSWVHTDSRKETRLSIAVGAAIEAMGNVEVART